MSPLRRRPPLPIRIGIISGTGFEMLIPRGEEAVVKTPYGPSSEIIITSFANKKIAFMPRHGKRHTLPPHKINFKANIWALHELGVERILATNAVGGINPDFKPGDFIVVHDFADFTKARPTTFYEGPPVTHIDLTNPYCPELREILIEASRKVVERVFDKGVYVCTEGPRYETPAEIKAFSRLGFDVVGMTGLPEAILARELEVCYATICIVTNYAAGMQKQLTTNEVVDVMKLSLPLVKKIFELAVPKIPEKRTCICSKVLKKAKLPP